MAKKKDIGIGDIVTCSEKVEAYYSRRGVAHECWFEPGDFGIVASVDVPAVTTRNGKEYSFCCIDFFKPGVLENPTHDPAGTRPWRCALTYNNIVKLA